MLPEWNIKGVIIEPGGFRTEWGGSSMLRLPIHPAYDKPHAPGVRFRELTKTPVFIGDPRKAAQAIMEVASMPDPPLRVQLGTDALMMVRNKARMTLRDNEQYEELAHSTNADGVDKQQVTARRAEINK